MTWQISEYTDCSFTHHKCLSLIQITVPLHGKESSVEGFFLTDIMYGFSRSGQDMLSYAVGGK